jgi:hypothetical protein
LVLLLLLLAAFVAISLVADADGNAGLLLALVPDIKTALDPLSTIEA